MNKIIFPILISSFLNNPVNAQVLSEKDVKLIQEKVDAQLKDTSLSEDKKLLLAITTAKEAFSFHYYDLANKYYEIAIKSSSKENKAEAYINRLAISLKQKEKSKISTQLEELKKYIQANDKYKTKEIEYYIKSIDASLSHNESPENIPGFYGQYATEEQFKNLITDKKYDKALAFINPNVLAENNDSFTVISYDTLNILVNKKNVTKLYCSEELKKYPDAYAYGPLICQLLTDYLKSGKMQKGNLARTEKYFKTNSPNMKFLFEAVKGIK